MIARFGLLTRHPSRSSETFFAHWRGAHGTLAAGLPGLRAYAQHRIRQQVTLRGPDAAPLDGISELHFDDMAALQAALASAAFAGVSGDEHGFLEDVRLVNCARDAGGAGVADGPSALLLLNGDAAALPERLFPTIMAMPDLAAQDRNRVISHDGRNLAGDDRARPAPDALVVLRFKAEAAPDPAALAARLSAALPPHVGACRLCLADSLRIV